MQHGTITEITERQSGFIKRKGYPENLFFHSDDLVGVTLKQLKAGDKLSFRVMETNKGPYAIEVKQVH